MMKFRAEYKTEERRLMTRLEDRDREQILLDIVFLVISRPSINGMKSTYIGEGNVLYSIYKFKNSEPLSPIYSE